MINTFKQKLLPFICPLENSILRNFDIKRLKLLTNVLDNLMMKLLTNVLDYLMMNLFTVQEKCHF